MVSIFARLREESPKMKFTIKDGGGGGRRGREGERQAKKEVGGNQLIDCWQELSCAL